MPITSLTSFFNTSSFGDRNTYTQNQQELALTLDCAAQELSNWKALLSMSAGGGAFELGRLAATTFFTAVPVLSAIPVLTNTFSFVAGAMADTSFTSFISQLLGEGDGEGESFFERVSSQGSVRAMGLVGAGQSFAVLQLLMGLSSVSQGMLCGENPKKEQGGMLGSIIQGLRCHFGSGMFAGLTGGVVAAVEQRISLRTKNMNNVGANLACPPVVWRVFAQNRGRSQGSPLQNSGPSFALSFAGGAAIHPSLEAFQRPTRLHQDFAEERTSASVSSFVLEAPAPSEIYREFLEISQRNQTLLQRYVPHLETRPEISRRFYFLKGRHDLNVSEMEGIKDSPEECYAVDLKHRALLLQTRILELGRELGESLEMEQGGHVRLRDYPRPLLPPVEKPAPTEEERAERERSGVYPELINQKYPGIDLELRPYQCDGLRAFDADLTRAELLGTSGEDYEGTVVFPTGAGKTRLMVGMMAVTLARGNFKEGDKWIVTTHLEEVTEQNVDAIRQNLAADFLRVMKRELKVTVVADKSEDFSGDVVVMSIPKVGRKSFNLGEKLKTALAGHSIPLAVMDEIHHQEAATWQEVKRILRTANGGKSYIVGLTATPTGDERNVFCRESVRRLIQAGVLPNLQLVEAHSGVHLDVLRRKNGEDFNAVELEGVVNVPERNRFMLQQLEKYGVRKEEEEGQLAPVSMTTVGIRHAYELGEMYVKYFAQEKKAGHAQQDLRGRRIALVGIKKEKSGLVMEDEAQIQALLDQKTKGEYHAVVAVLTGETSKKARKLILKAWEAGEIETVISIGVIGEGFDGDFIQTTVGGRASKSVRQKTQEVGRMLRRMADEISFILGKIIKRVRRVAIDIQDIYPLGYLQTYREALECDQVIPRNTLWDVGNGKPVQAGDGILVPPPKAPRRRSSGSGRERPEVVQLEVPVLVWTKTLEELEGWLQKTYEGHSEEMAFDLALDPQSFKRIMEGKEGWEGRVELAFRIATLLYRKRDTFLKAYFQDLANVGNEQYFVLEVLREELKAHLKSEGKRWGDETEFRIDMGAKAENYQMKRGVVENFHRERFASVTFATLAQALVDTLKVRGLVQRAEVIIQAMNAAYEGRLNWDKRTKAFEGMLWSEVESLDPVVASKLEEGKAIYLVTTSDAALQANGKFRGWLSLSENKPDEGRCFVKFEKQGKRIVITDSGGNNHKLLAKALRSSGLVGWSASYVFKNCEYLSEFYALAASDPLFLFHLAEERWGKAKIPRHFYIVGTSANIVKSGERIYGNLLLSETAPEGRGAFVKLEVEGTQIKVVQDEERNNQQNLAEALRDSGLAEWNSDFRSPRRWTSSKTKREERVSVVSS